MGELNRICTVDGVEPPRPPSIRAMKTSVNSALISLERVRLTLMEIKKQLGDDDEKPKPMEKHEPEPQYPNPTGGRR